MSSEPSHPEPLPEPRPLPEQASVPEQASLPEQADELLTPVFLAHGPAVASPGAEPRTYYVLAANGLFLVRNHAFFRSSVPAPSFPSELGEQHEAFEPRFPKIPRDMLERIVAFFSAVAEAYGAEAGVLLYWDPEASAVHVIAPPQVATITRGYRGRGQPVGLHYEVPHGVPPAWILFGDVHSHAQLAAFASATDQDDEVHAPGLHIVVGEIHREPPSFHVEAVVDERRFTLSLADVVEGYERRATRFPLKWLRRLRVVDAWEYQRLRALPPSAAAAAEPGAEAELADVSDLVGLSDLMDLTDISDLSDGSRRFRAEDLDPPAGGAPRNGTAGPGT